MKTKSINVRIPEDLHEFVDGYENVTITEIVIQSIREFQYKTRKFERMQEMMERKKSV